MATIDDAWHALETSTSNLARSRLPGVRGALVGCIIDGAPLREADGVLYAAAAVTVVGGIAVRCYRLRT